MKFIRKITWLEIWGDWKKNEATQESWRAHFKERGFKTWEEWRSKLVEEFNLDKAEWELFEVSAEDVRDFYVGPFKGWKNYHGKKFGEFCEDYKENEKVKGILAAFPRDSMIIGIRDGKKVVILEGSHRCSAVSLAAKGNLFIAIAK